MKALLFVTLLLTTPAIAGDDDSVTMTHEQAARLLARYQQALQEHDEVLAEMAKLRQRMEICWAGYGGFKR